MRRTKSDEKNQISGEFGQAVTPEICARKSQSKRIEQKSGQINNHKESELQNSAGSEMLTQLKRSCHT